MQPQKSPIEAFNECSPHPRESPRCCLIIASHSSSILDVGRTARIGFRVRDQGWSDGMRLPNIVDQLYFAYDKS